MGTRATYLIESGVEKQRICFYINWDGYPEGAAEYFWNMHNTKNNRGGYAGRFVRGNELAEFTLNHEIYSDTEYRYNLDRDGKLKAWARTGSNSDIWVLFYNGTWYEFVNQYRKSFSKLYFFSHKDSKKESVMTLAEARIYVKEKTLEAAKFLNNGCLNNSEYSQEEALHINEQINNICNSSWQ